MAEEKRSINISYKADLKDLIAKLKQMPNVTEAEAKKMVAALDRQLKQAEKASKKSADASAKAAKEAAKAARRGASDFDELANSARRAEERLERVGDASGNIDRGFSSVGLALRNVNPQLAGAADGIADAFAVTEGLSMSFASLNPLLLAGGAAIGALTFGFTLYQAEAEKAKQLTLDLKDAQKQLNESQLAQEDNLIDAGGQLRAIRNEYKLLTGQITEYEFNLEKAGETAFESFRGNIEAADKTIQNTEMQIAAVESLNNAFLKSTPAVLSDEMVNQLRTLQLQNKAINNNIDLTDRSATSNFELLELHKILLDQLNEQKKERKVLGLMQDEAVELSMEMVTLEKELADDTEEAAKQSENLANNDERALRAKEKYAALMEEALSMGDEQIKEYELQQKMDRQLAEAFIDEEGKKALAAQDRIQEQIAQIEMLGIATGREAEAAMAIEALKHQQKMENFEEEGEKIDELQKKREEGAQKNLESALKLGNLAAELSNNLITNSQIEIDMASSRREEIDKMSEIERSAYEKKQKQLRALFVFQKGMSIAEIAMKTAEAITAAQKLIPPFNFIQTGIAAATGAAQMGVVLSQQMPSFHMGGLASDESTARVLKGEAVLDRATVRRIGGEQGVKNLQQGASPSVQTVVIQPFKHFGRFAKDLGISQPKRAGIRGY